MAGLLPDVTSLLTAHGIDAPEQPMTHSGFSGARLSRIEQGAERYVVKRIDLADDWIMRETGDSDFREAQFAVSPLVARLPPQAGTPSIGAARDGSGAAILMRDVTSCLLAGDRPATTAQTDALLGAMAAMHVRFWGDPLADVEVSWCNPRDRILILSPSVGRKLVDESRDFGVAAGWRAFDEHAPLDAQRLVRSLFDDPSRLVDVANTLPQTLLHGDIKFGNIAIDPGSRVLFFDWALVMHGPVALDLSWFPAVNTPQIPWSIDETIERYGEHLRAALGKSRFAEAEWPRQRAIAAIRTLMLMGWAKALDHEAGRPHELEGVCARALTGAAVLGL